MARARAAGSIRADRAASPPGPGSPPVTRATASTRRSSSGRGVELAAMATPNAASATGAAAVSRRVSRKVGVQSKLANSVSVSGLPLSGLKHDAG